MRKLIHSNPSKSKSTSSIPKLKPGTYQATVSDIMFPEEFASQNVLRVHYSVETPAGIISYTETFWLVQDHLSERAMVFTDILTKAGLETYEDSVGSRWELDFKKDVTARGVFLNIVSRKLLEVAEKEVEQHA